MKTTLRLLAIAFVLATFAGVSARAQSLAQFSFPANNTIGFPVGDSLIITTHWKIDTSCLVWNEITNVYVLSQYTYDSVADSLRGPMSAALKCNLLNDTTLSITLGTLDNGINYIAQINALRVINSLGDTLAVPDTIKISFKTAYGTQEILGSSVLDSSGSA